MVTLREKALALIRWQHGDLEPTWSPRQGSSKKSTSALRNRSQRGGHCFQHAGAEVRE